MDDNGNGGTPTPTGQWFEYRRLVLNQLETLERNMTGLRDSVQKALNELRDYIVEHNKERDDDIAKLRERIAVIEAKAAAYGFVAGLIISVVVALIRFVKV